MKIKFSTLAVGLLLGMLCIAPSCSRVDELDNRVTDLEKKMKNLDETQLPTLLEQVKILQDFKTQLEATLPQQIAALEGKITGLDDKYKGIVDEINGKITGLDGKITGLDGKISDLDGKITGLDGKISDLDGKYEGIIGALKAAYDAQIGAINGQISDLQSGKLDAATFDDYKKLTDQNLEIINMVLDGFVEVDPETGEISVYNVMATLENIYTIISKQISTLSQNDQYLLGLINQNTKRIGTVEGDVNDIYDSLAVHNEKLEALKVLASTILEFAQDVDEDLQGFKLEVARDYLTKADFEQFKASAIAKAQAIEAKIKADSTVLATGIHANTLMIEALAAKEKADSLELATRIDDVEDSISAHRAEIEALKEKANENAENIIKLQEANRKLLEETIPGINQEIDNLKGEDIKLWAAIQDIILNKITPLQAQADRTDEKLDSLCGEVKGIKNLVGALPEDITSFTAWVQSHEDAIKTLNGKVEQLEKDVKALQGAMVDVQDLLKNRIQSIVYVPEYRDGMITINTVTLAAEDVKLQVAGKTSTILYQVEPENLADTIADAFEAKALEPHFQAALLKTRGTMQFDILDLEVVGMKSLGHKGYLAITVIPDEKTVDDLDKTAIALVLKDFKGNSRTTEYTNVIGSNTAINMFLGVLDDDKLTRVEKEYNDPSDTTFFLEKANTPYFYVEGTPETKYTPAQVKTTFGVDVKPYIVSKIKYVLPTPEVAASYEIEAQGDTAYTVSLSSDIQEAAKVVNDTLRLFKKYGITDAPYVGEADADTTWQKKPFRGQFITLPLSLNVRLDAQIAWNFAKDVTGDRKLIIEKADSFAYARKDVAVAVTSEDVTTKSAYGAADFDHVAELSWTVCKRVGVDTVALSPAEQAALKCVPAFDKTTSTFKLAEFSGFNFLADEYIFTAEYPIGDKEVLDDKDIVSVELGIALTDRVRKPIVHTFAARTVDVTTDFADALEYTIYTSDNSGEYNYFADVIASYNAEIADCVKAEDFAPVWNWTGVYAAGKPTTTFSNNIEKITVTLPYTVEDITGNYAEGFELSDTLLIGYGQRVVVKCPVTLSWPTYDFLHNEFYVAQNAETDKYFSKIEPYYELNGQPVEATSAIDKFDVQLVDVKKCFDVVDATGAKIASPADLGLTVSYVITDEPAHEGVTMDGDYKIKYHGSVDSVIVKGILTLAVDDTTYTLTTSFDTVATVAGKYAGYYVKKFNPFKAFTQTEIPSLTVNAPMKYSFNIRQYMSLTDSRDVECLDYTVSAYPNSFWVIGNGTNGFGTGANAKVVYGIGEMPITWDAPDAPDNIKENIKLVGNELSFDNTGEVKLVKDVEVKLNVTFHNVWGDYTLPMSFLFKAPQN